jgi:predicted transposase/invertase (TIGR01784 family)
MTEPKYINPFTDFGFKKIFGEEANKDLLIDFLNELLASQNRHIKDLTFNKTNRLGTTGLDRNVVFDLYCESETGEKFTVELQKAKQSFFKDRMLYYSSFSVQEQGIKGDWNYQLKPVYVVGILDFIIEENKKSDIVVSHNQLMDNDRHTVFYDKLTFVTLQMPNFTKTENELETNFDKWLFVIKNLHRLDNIPERLKTKIFEKLFKTASYSALNKADRDKYEESLKYYNDLKNSLDTAFDDGKEEARLEMQNLIKEAQNREEEERKQKEEARQKESEATQKFARKMLKYGESVEEIMKESGLSREEIERIK